ncbi:hypothetical protein ABPG72_019796 [Tetrahymena utriculariae]
MDQRKSTVKKRLKTLLGLLAVVNLFRRLRTAQNNKTTFGVCQYWMKGICKNSYNCEKKHYQITIIDNQRRENKKLINNKQIPPSNQQRYQRRKCIKNHSSQTKKTREEKNQKIIKQMQYEIVSEIDDNDIEIEENKQNTSQQDQLQQNQQNYQQQYVQHHNINNNINNNNNITQQ